MEKDFDKWNGIKKQAHGESPRLYTVREIWWCRLGVNIGTEQDGGDNFLRPVVIMAAFGSNACCVVPLTKSSREHLVRVPVGLVQGKNASANISQIRVVDTRRLVKKMGFLDERMFENIRKTIRSLF